MILALPWIPTVSMASAVILGIFFSKNLRADWAEGWLWIPMQQITSVFFKEALQSSLQGRTQIIFSLTWEQGAMSKDARPIWVEVWRVSCTWVFFRKSCRGVPEQKGGSFSLEVTGGKVTLCTKTHSAQRLLITLFSPTSESMVLEAKGIFTWKLAPGGRPRFPEFNFECRKQNAHTA